MFGSQSLQTYNQGPSSSIECASNGIIDVTVGTTLALELAVGADPRPVTVLEA